MMRKLRVKTPIENSDFTNFIKDIKQKILSSQYEALKSVNKELINLYWDIGKNIVLRQEAFGWGKSVVKNLSDELRREFVGMKGFSERNLWNMRNFYVEYQDNLKLQALTAEIGWTHNVVIFQKSKEKKRVEQRLNFAVRIVNLFKYLSNEKKEYGKVYIYDTIRGRRSTVC